MLHPFRHAAALGVLALGLAACSDGSSSPSHGNAELTVVHATASLGAVTVTIGGAPVVSNLSYGSASRPVAVPAGTQHVIVRAGNDVISDFETSMTTEHVNAIVIANGAAQVSGTVIPDTGAVAAARANLRLVNVTGSTSSDPVNLDILINSPGVSPDSTARLGGLDTRVASYSSLLYFDAGHFRLRYVPQGTTTVLAEASFDIALGEVKVAVLSRDASGVYHVTITSEGTN